MKQFNNVNLQTIEDFVIETGEDMTVYAVGPLHQNDLNLYRYYQSEPEAKAAFMERGEEGIGASAALIRFYLNENGYIQVKPEKSLTDWMSLKPAVAASTVSETSSANKAVVKSEERDNFDQAQEYAQQKYHEAQAGSAAIRDAENARLAAQKNTDDKAAAYYAAQTEASRKYDDVAQATVAQDQQASAASQARKAAELAMQQYNEAKAAAQMKYNESVAAAKAANDEQNALDEAARNTVKVTEIYVDAQDNADAKYQDALNAIDAENQAIDAVNQAVADAEAAVSEFNEAEARAFQTGVDNLNK